MRSGNAVFNPAIVEVVDPGFRHHAVKTAVLGKDAARKSQLRQIVGNGPANLHFSLGYISRIQVAAQLDPCVDELKPSTFQSRDSRNIRFVDTALDQPVGRGQQGLMGDACIRRGEGRHLHSKEVAIPMQSR
jgi:hypothetical protein